jgi:hypothetical protein
MDKRQSKRKREVVLYVFVRMHPAQLAGASDARMIFVLPGNYHQLLRSPFHSERSYKIKKTYSDLRFYQGDLTGRAECLTHHSFRLAFVLVATQSH